MRNYDKISPALTGFLDEQRPDAFREAIVIFRGKGAKPNICDYSNRTDRKKFIEDVSESIAPLNKRVIEKYRTIFRKRTGAKKGEAQVTLVESAALPVGKIPVTRNTLLDLAEMEEVVAILPNTKLDLIDPHHTKFDGPENDERRDEMTWGIKELQIDALWKQGWSGKGIRVAVLDTGVHGSHASLKERILDFVIVDPLGNKLRLEDSQTFDSDRHGTHVCGTIAGGKTEEGIAIGVAPDAKLLVAAVLIGRTTLWSLMEAVGWAVQNEARVINLSLGLRAYEPKLAEFCQQLVDEYDVVPVAAIGNENHGNTSSPGNSPSALSVGALDKGYRGRLSVPYFSSGASLILDEVRDGNFAIVNKPDIVAPGVAVYSAIPPEDRADGSYSHAYMDGTSMSAPHVSGAVALLMQAVPNASARSIIEAIKSTAEYKGQGRAPDNRWGMGVIRPLKALEHLKELLKKGEQ